MLNIPVPYEKLLVLQAKLGLDQQMLEELDPFRETFISKKNDFAAFFRSVFFGIPETRLILEYEDRPGVMVRIWANWFETIFRSKLDDAFFSYLWRIGLRHVEVNLDQRFSNLGFSVIRQFCHEVALSEISHGCNTAVLRTIDRLLDFCLLVETSAYIEATTRCDIEIIRGIADRVRNPVTVIGGSIKRLQKKLDSSSPTYSVYESLIGENQRLEHMVSDVKMYFDMFEAVPQPRLLQLDELIRYAVDRVRVNGLFAHVGLRIDISRDADRIRADRWDMECLFYHLIQNSFEASDPKAPLVSICSTFVTSPHHGIRVEVFNNGSPLKIEDIEKLYSPFYSTKPQGTGFGLPIIRLALRKNFGKILFQPVPHEGTKVIVTLPAPDDI
jgi:signal transduction histidine kinase